MKLFAKRALIGQEWKEKQVVTVENGVITDISAGTCGDYNCDVLTAGLFDVHTHGGMGYYVTDTREEMQQKYLDELQKHGVTDILLGTGSYADYSGILRLCRETMEKQEKGEKGGARIRGLHLEGPFLNPGKCGAMDPKKMPASSAETFEKIFGEYEDLVRLVTVAPEVPGAGELMDALLAKGFKVQIGHTLATFEEARAAFKRGANSLCHTFNAAPSIHHRNPGAVTAALVEENVYCEAICDFVHLHSGIVELIYHAKGPDRMMIISDSGGPAGLPDGIYHMLEKDFEVRNGACYVMGTNTLAGGHGFSDCGVRNIISLGIPSEHAVRMATYTPARRLGMTRTGLIAPGFEAHLAAWDENWQCTFTVIGDQVTEN